MLKRVPPPVDAAERTGKILARLWDVDEDSIIIADPGAELLVEELRAAEANAAAAAEPAARLKHELMAFMGESEVLLDMRGNKLATWKQNSTFRDGEFQAEQPETARLYVKDPKPVTDTKRLAEDKPDLYRQYRSRQFRLGKPAS